MEAPVSWWERTVLLVTGLITHDYLTTVNRNH